MTRLVICSALLLALSGCGEEEATSKTSGGDEAKTAKVIEMAAQSGKLTAKSGGREITYAITVDLPTGWKEVANKRSLRFTENGEQFGSSSVQFDHRAIFKDVTTELAKTRDMLLKFSKGGEIVLEKQVDADTWQFVLKNGQKIHGIVAHRQTGWSAFLQCEFMLSGDDSEMLDAVLKGCVDAKLEMNDPYYPKNVLAKEAVNVAQCPKETTLTYKTLKPAAGEPSAFGEVKASYAPVSRYGTDLSIYIANFDTTQTRFRKEETLKGDQVVARFGLSVRTEKDAPKQVPFSGDYTVTFDKEVTHRATPRLEIAEGKSLGWSARNTTGKVTVIAHTREKLCGTIELLGGNRGDLKGTFNIDL
jgi:hypothetical protein